MTPVFTVCNPPFYVSTSDNGSTTFLWYRSLFLSLLEGGKDTTPPPPSSLWPMQRRFAHRGKFLKLLDDRGEIISDLGYSTSFPRNQKSRTLPIKIYDISSINPPRKLMESAGRNATTSGIGSIRISSQGLFSSWRKLWSENVARSRLVAPGIPSMDEGKISRETQFQFGIISLLKLQAQLGMQFLRV